MIQIFSCYGRLKSPTIYFQKNVLLPKFFSHNQKLIGSCKNKDSVKSEIYTDCGQNSIWKSKQNFDSIDEMNSTEDFQDFRAAIQWKNEEFFGVFHEYSFPIVPKLDTVASLQNQKANQISLNPSTAKNSNNSNGRYSSRNIARILFAFFFDHSKKNLPWFVGFANESSFQSFALNPLKIDGLEKRAGKNFSRTPVKIFGLISLSPNQVLGVLHRFFEYFATCLLKSPERVKLIHNGMSRGIRNLTNDENFPSFRIHQRKIPLLPFFFCLVPYILFLGIRQSFSLLSSSNSLENFLLLRNPLFTTENTSLARLFHSNSEEHGNTKMERKIRRLMSSHKAFSEFQNKIDQNKNVDIFVDHSFGFENQNWVLSFPSSLSKFFVVWAIQKIASIRPQRRMTEKAEQSQQARVLFPHEISVKFENLQGLTAVLPLLHLFIQSLQTGWFPQEFTSGFQKKKVFKDQESKYPKGYLFVGPPGTGKTQLAQALAKEANLPLLCVSASEIQKQIEIGTRIGGLRLRKVFEKAREYAPCILFFDEIDAIGKTRGQQGSSDSQLLTEFLIQMDSFSVRDGFVVVGTTNFLSNLDSAFIRSGRFDRILNLHSPSKKIRLDILQSAVYKKNLAEKSERKAESPKIPWKYFAHYTEDFSPAHLARLVNESFLYSCEKSISSSVLSQSVFIKKIHHSFESLQHGFHRIQNHRKNFL